MENFNWGLLLFLLCPLMHIFMMRGHKHNHSHNSHEGTKKTIDEEQKSI